MSSDSDLNSLVQSIETSVIIPVVVITVVAYDYILTFSKEVDNVWCKPWTRVSTLFLIVRYLGLLWAVLLALTGCVLLPGPDLACTVLFAIGDWAYMIFLAAADLVMILRVYALWSHNKVILGILLFIYIPQIFVSFIWEIVYYSPGNTLEVSVGQVLNFKFCNYASTLTTPSATWRALPRFVLGAVMLILAVIPTLKYSINMYRVTKTWQSNRSIKLLLKEGAVYFVVNLLFNIVNAITLANFDFLIFLDSFSYAVSCTIVPRFIISIRALYDRDQRNRYQGLDTGFGMCSQTVGHQNTATAFSGISFGPTMEDMETNGYMERSNAIPLKAVGGYAMKI